MLQPISTTVSRNHSKHMKTERLKHNGGSVPEAKDFSICALKIMDDCAQKKCLRGGLYFFNDVCVRHKMERLHLILSVRFLMISMVQILIYKQS